MMKVHFIDGFVMIEFHHPEGERLQAATPYDLSLDLAGDATVTLGLLANGFPGSVAFLDAVETVLKKRKPELKIARMDKGNASVSAPEPLLHDISEQCDGLIAAYGH